MSTANPRHSADAPLPPPSRQPLPPQALLLPVRLGGDGRRAFDEFFRLLPDYVKDMNELGENGIEERAEILKDLSFFGVDFDEKANQVKGEDTIITKPNSRTTAMVVSTNEELVIATDTYKLVK